MDYIIQLLTAFLGSFGLACCFNVRNKDLFIASFGGVINWAAYLICVYFSFGIFMASFIASFVSALYAEILARIRKAPVTSFLITSVIPLIPGSTLYYTMNAVTKEDWALMREFGMKTLYCALGIALGISLVSALFIMFIRFKERKNLKGDF